MGFFDTVKKGAELAKKGLDMADESMKKKFARMSDSDILTALDENSNNKYARAEADSRGIS